MSKISKREMKNIKKRKQQQREIMIEKRKRDTAVIEQAYKEIINSFLNENQFPDDNKFVESLKSIVASLELNEVPNREYEIQVLKLLNSFLNDLFLNNPSYSSPLTLSYQSVRLYLIKKLTINNAEFPKTVQVIFLDESSF